MRRRKQSNKTENSNSKNNRNKPRNIRTTSSIKIIQQFFDLINTAVNLPPDHEINIRITVVIDGIRYNKDSSVMKENGWTDKDDFIFNMLHHSCPKKSGGPGVIALKKDFFREHLSESFQSSNEAITAILNGNWGENSFVFEKATKEKAIMFIEDSSLNSIGYQPSRIMSGFPHILNSVTGTSSYPTKGMLLQVVDKKIREKLNGSSEWEIIFEHSECLPENEKGESNARKTRRSRPVRNENAGGEPQQNNQHKEINKRRIRRRSIR